MMKRLWSRILAWVRGPNGPDLANKIVTGKADRDTYPPEDKDRFKGDPEICKRRGHWHSYKSDWIVEGVDFGPSTGHNDTCMRCGWRDPCVWT